MNKIYYVAAVLMMGLTACSVEPAFEQEKVKEEVAVNALPGQLLVKFEPHVADVIEQAGMTKSADILSIVKDYELERVFPVDPRNEELTRKEGLHLWYVVRFSEEYSVEKVAADMAKLGHVNRVEFNRTLKRADNNKAVPLTMEKVRQLTQPAASPAFNDPLLPNQWHLVNNGDLRPTKFVKDADVQVEKAWTELRCTGDPSIIVAVLDEGVDVTHPDLKTSMWVNEGEIWKSDKDNDGNGYCGDIHGFNFVQNTGVISTNSLNDTGHGTHVAGVIAAANNNGKGISSIAGGNGTQPGVKIMSCQIFSGAYAGTVLEEVRAIKYAADNGAVILQCSWGYISGAANPYEWTPQYSTDEEWETYNILEKNALDYFIHNAGSPDGVIDGGLAIFAGGNEAAAAASYPGAYPDFIAVAATAGDFTPAVYSNYGPGTTISAPGGDQDYYWEYADEDLRIGEVGCILSTLPYHVSESGYGYMEGTSMACPHVSGVVALGLSYAAQLRRHFTAEEFKQLVYDTATPIDDYMKGTKQYKRYVIDLGSASPTMSLELNAFKGGMGNGQINAYALLKAVEGAGTEMTFPNIYVAEGGQTTALPSMYMPGDKFTVNVENESVATAEIVDGKMIIKGLKVGQTNAVLTGSREDRFVITVREAANGNGWL